MDPLFQLVANGPEVWALIKWIISGNAGTGKKGKSPFKPPTSVSSFKCLQGLAQNEKAELLHKVVSGEYTLKELAVAATELKVINRIKVAFVNELSCSDWDQAETLYPTIFTDVKQWIFAF